MKKIMACIFFVFAPEHTFARDYTFSPSLLGDVGHAIDLNAFSEGAHQPGMYYMEIYLNGKIVDQRDISFIKSANNTIIPCLDTDILISYGLSSKFSQEKDKCFSDYSILGINIKYNIYKQKLDITIPQAFLRGSPKNHQNKENWDEGIPAFIMNYRLSKFYSKNSNYDNSSTFVHLSPGANIGPWRLRNQMYWKDSKKNGSNFENTHTYLERGLNDLNSMLTIGERYTPNNIFESVPFRGVMIATEDLMNPASMRAFSPVIQGIARTEASIEIKQRGYTIYKTTVPPGPYSINDISLSSGSGGVLDVTVTESDGDVKTYQVNYQSPAISVKQGYANYNIMSGRYRNSYDSSRDPFVFQSTIIYGLPFDATLYTGLQLSEQYQSSIIGLGKSMGSFGSVSIDLKNSHTTEHENITGYSERIRYSKNIIDTKTNISLSAMRTSSHNYQDLNEYIVGGHGLNGGNNLKIKSNDTFSLNQDIFSYGSLSANYSRLEYWGSDSKVSSIGVGYVFKVYRSISASFFYSELVKQKEQNNFNKDRTASLSINIPLKELYPNDYVLRQRVVNDKDGGIMSLTSLSGTSFEKKVNWELGESYTRNNTNGQGGSTYIRTGFNSSYGDMSASYDFNNTYQNKSFYMSGGMIGHENGLTLGKSITNSVALIEAKDASNVGLRNNTSVITDYNGYAYTSSLSPYKANNIGLNPLTFPDNTDILITDKTVIPTKNAIVMAKFDTKPGVKANFKLIDNEGRDIPFGSVVYVDSTKGVGGIVGSGGNVYITGLKKQGLFHIKWNNGYCLAKYNIPDGYSLTESKFLTAKCN